MTHDDVQSSNTSLPASRMWLKRLVAVFLCMKVSVLFLQPVPKLPRLREASIPLSGNSEGPMDGDSCATAHDDPVDQRNVRFLERADVVVELILPPKEAAQIGEEEEMLNT